MAYTPIGSGAVGEDVAALQRYLSAWSKADPGRYPPVIVNGTYDAATIAAVQAFQRVNGLAQTGNWNAYTYNKAVAVTRYMTGGRRSEPFTAHNTIAQDRQWVVTQYQAFFGRPPTEIELLYDVDRLQRGTTYADLTARMEKRYAPEAVTKIFTDVYGRPPTEAERTQWETRLRTGVSTRASMTEYLATTHEALTRPKVVTPAEGSEDSRAVMNEMLDGIGLGSLKDWAWEQIQAGHSSVRILQDLRTTDAYRARFDGLIRRVENGLPAMTEDQYLAYEEGAEQLMRANGLPLVFRNQAAYADLIAANVSLAELNDRVVDGFVRVNTAPTEVRDKYAEWFGPAGDAALAAFFLDAERALPALREQIATAEVGGIGAQFDLDFTFERAQRIAQAGVDKDSARQGFAQLQQLDPLFEETISEEDDLTAIDEGADAIFNLGGSGATELERRSRERTAATSGGGGAAVGSSGTGLGSAD